MRVFPRKTNATPTDDKAYYDGPPIWQLPENEVHVSCTFTYDKPRAEQLAQQWQKAGYNVTLGGPAYDDNGGDFVPGRYLKPGYVITSRGCNNNCWFCVAPKREGKIRELPITDGWILQDNNLLQCSDSHIKAVFEMLKRQPHKAVFSGGIEARELKDWHVDLFVDLKPQSLFLAYDTPDDYEPLVRASKMFSGTSMLKQHKVQCYVLIGWPRDTIEQAEERLHSVVALGLMPFAMLYRNERGEVDKQWQRFQREWANPVIVGCKMKTLVENQEALIS